MREIQHGTPDSFNTLQAYWNVPSAREIMDRQIADNRATVNAAIDAGMAKVNARQAEFWAQDDCYAEWCEEQEANRR